MRIRCLLAVFLSGISALTLEILWQRQMFLVFGASAPATTAVLTAIFLGIAFGSLLARPLRVWFSHPLLLFAAMELLIGAWAILLPSFLPLAVDLYAPLAGVIGEENPLLNGVRFGMAVTLMMPATLCMGATIPVMVAVLSDSGRLPVSTIYGLNTLGAVLGSLGTGLFLIPRLGMQNARMVAVSFNAAAVLICFATHRSIRLFSDGDTGLVGPPPKLPSAWRQLFQLSAAFRLPAFLYFGAGFVALGLEIVWLRVLAIVNTNSTITFSVALAVYLLAMGLGSLGVYPALCRIFRPRMIFGLAGFAVAMAALCTFPIVYSVPQINYRMIAEPAAEGRLTLSDLYSTEAMIIGGLMFFPALCMGLVYPAVCHWFSGEDEDNICWTGTAYFLGTMGSVVGTLTVAMLIIPAVGLHAAFGLLVALSGGIGCLSLLKSQTGSGRWLSFVGFALVCGGALWIVIDARPVLREFPARKIGTRWFEFSVVNPQERISEIRRFRAGSSATVIVKKKPDSDDHLVYVDDQLVASTNMEARVDALMLAHLPLLLHPRPASELTVGFGSGGTSYAITTHDIDAFCVEIEPEVPRSAALLGKQNFGVLEHPRFRLILNDARDHLTVGARSYDVIATDVTNLQYKQNSSLYTVEYFRLMQRQLHPGGIACAWIPMAAISTEELRILMKSFQHVFPHATLWFMNHTHTNFGILIGTSEELRIDYRRFDEGFRIPAVAENLRLIGVTDPLQIIHSLHVDEDAYRKFCGDVVLHTENHPCLEFSSPLSFYQYNSTFRDNLKESLRHRPRDLRQLMVNLPEGRAADWERHRAGGASFCRVLVNFYEFLIQQGQGNRGAAVASLNAAIRDARAGMEAFPDDHSREEFYVNFFEQAQQWMTQ